MYCVCACVRACVRAVCHRICCRSGDSTARLWRLHDDAVHDPPMVLPHEPVGAVGTEVNRDVTTVHWNVGSLVVYHAMLYT